MNQPGEGGLGAVGGLQLCSSSVKLRGMMLIVTLGVWGVDGL